MLVVRAHSVQWTVLMLLLEMQWSLPPETKVSVCSLALIHSNYHTLYHLTGFQIGGCGDLSIRFRPALVFAPSHANMFLDAFELVLSEMK